MKNLQIVHQKLNVVVKNTRVIIDIIQVDYLSPFFLIKNSFLFVDVRQEAVKQALEQFGARPIPSSKRILNPQTKRTSIKHLVFFIEINFSIQMNLVMKMMMKVVQHMLQPLMINTIKNHRFLLQSKIIIIKIHQLLNQFSKVINPL